MSVSVRSITIPVPASLLRLTMSVPRLLVIRVISVRVSLGMCVGILRVGIVYRSGCPRRLWVVRLLSVRVILIVAVVDIVVVRNVSVVGISTSTARNGGGR